MMALLFPSLNGFKNRYIVYFYVVPSLLLWAPQSLRGRGSHLTV